MARRKNESSAEYLGRMRLYMRDRLKSMNHIGREKLSESKKNYYQKNREKILEYRKNWQIANKEKIWEAHLRSEYGMSPEEYNELLIGQGGRCRLCSRTFAGYRRGERLKLHVDHCHSTGMVRGLLCRSCNVAIGAMEDNPARLRAAADYIESFSSKP